VPRHSAVYKLVYAERLLPDRHLDNFQNSLLRQPNMHMKMKDLYLLNKVRARQVAGLDDDIGRVNLKLGKQTQGLHFAQKLVYLLRCLTQWCNHQ
jgi:hypothetical protein